MPLLIIYAIAPADSDAFRQAGCQYESFCRRKSIRKRRTQKEMKTCQGKASSIMSRLFWKSAPIGGLAASQGQMGDGLSETNLCQ